MPSPNQSGTDGGSLYGVAVVPRSPQAWAVGFGNSGLILHSAGTRWEQVPDPSPDDLYAVTAVSRTDAWAVGSSVTLHWNGTTWKAEPFAPDGVLYGVAATSSRNAWAVGHSALHPEHGVMLVRWNGKDWKEQTIPRAGADSFFELDGVAAASATDAWAVGDSRTVGAAGSAPLILHWNGKAWKRVRIPKPKDPADSFNLLEGVAATSATSAWAAGFDKHFISSLDYFDLNPFIEHWNGKRWTLVHSPDPTRNFTDLTAVTATSATSAWAVGADYENFSEYNGQALIEHWNGKTWHRVSSPNTVGLQAVAASSTRRFVWAVGARTSGSPRTLTLYHC